MKVYLSIKNWGAYTQIQMQSYIQVKYIQAKQDKTRQRMMNNEKRNNATQSMNKNFYFISFESIYKQIFK